MTSGRIVSSVLVIILFITVALRWFAINNIPGILGDEAWYAVQAHLFLSGKDYTWMVPSGRIFSPFYVLLAIAGQGADPFWIRLPALIMGILTVIISYPLLKKVLSSKASIVSTILIATLPAHIAYSKLAWEPCLIPLAGVLFCTFTLSRKWVPTLICLIVGTFNHPTFILLLPIPVTMFLFEAKKQNRLPSYPWIAGGCILLACLALWARTWIPTGFPIHNIGLDSASKFLYGVSAFISGDLIYETFSEPVHIGLKIIFTITVASGFTFLTWKCFRKLPDHQKAFFVGVLFSTLILFYMGGLVPVTPEHERAILFLGVPICLYFGVLIAELRRGVEIGIGIGLVYTVSFILLLFGPILEHGGPGNIQYHTGPSDPKIAAVEWVTKNSGNNQSRLLVEGWGTYWPAYNYLLNKKANVSLRHISAEPGMDQKLAIKNADELLDFFSSGGYAIGYAGGRLERHMQFLSSEGHKISILNIRDYGDRNFMRVWKIEGKMTAP